MGCLELWQLFCNLVGKKNRITEIPALLYLVSESAPVAKNMKYYLRKVDSHMTRCYLDLLLQLKLFLPNIMSNIPNLAHSVMIKSKSS